MKLLTKETDYAVRALLHLAGAEGEPVSTRTISEAQFIPLYFLRRIMRKMVAHGIVTTREGARGGVLLARDPDDLSLEELIRLFQGPIQLTDCLFRRKICPLHSACVLRARLSQIEETVTHEFSGITIGSLLRDFRTQETRPQSCYES